MSKFEVIPAIDIIDGQVVRLVQGKYDQVTTYKSSAVDVAKSFEDAGATRIHIVDLDGAKEGSVSNGDTIAAIRKAVSCTLELGGGIRSVDTAKKWLDIGVDNVILGSLLIKNRDEAINIIEQFQERVIIGLDMINGEIATEGWIETSDEPLPDVLKELERLNVSGIIYTNIKHDGMMIGPDLEGLKKIGAMTTIPVTASGGVRDSNDILDIHKISNISGCIIGKAFLSGILNLNTISEFSRI
ncbi:1-(5-phosphoribosyl)-5-[(5-phosphoribosylamino)methylideneamino]imidazole-4-carboxamide isomerase [bacterium]|nr:1-(5-phosphoribosyl)-5-[(5-phosphoribosylamino)methylideneamino]imidazole-4-carboxamide isomerase [bacterium]